MTLVLTGATLIDGTGAAPVADAAVIIDGERIIAAGPRRGLTWPATRFSKARFCVRLAERFTMHSS